MALDQKTLDLCIEDAGGDITDDAEKAIFSEGMQILKAVDGVVPRECVRALYDFSRINRGYHPKSSEHAVALPVGYELRRFLTENLHVLAATDTRESASSTAA